ncbi:hypothetical protein T484DRAFT_1979586, partial [Baffinella frigidus]
MRLGAARRLMAVGTACAARASTGRGTRNGSSPRGRPAQRAPKRPPLVPGCIPSLLPVHVLLRAYSATRACAAAPACVLACDHLPFAPSRMWHLAI